MNRFASILFQRSNALTTTCISRNVSGKKKFYKAATVAKVNDKYEIRLDQRKLRSPHGYVLELSSETLAHAVALEWDSQAEVLNPLIQPLSNLCFTSHDDVEELTAETIAEKSLKFLETDTVLYYMNEIPELAAQQEKKWGAIITWLNERFDIEIEHATGFSKPKISENAFPTLKNHIMSYEKSSLFAFEKMSNTLKSIILSLAVIDRHITCDEAVELALLEQRFQAKNWGNVEWHHDFELHESIMKTAACALYIQLHNEVSHVAPLNDADKLQ